VAVVISGNHDDPESWRDWTNKEKQFEYAKRFKRKLATERTEKTDPLAMMVVNNMLLTGFDAPIEQVICLDRKMVAHDLLQAIARVNRTCGRKKCGYVVDCCRRCLIFIDKFRCIILFLLCFQNSRRS